MTATSVFATNKPVIEDAPTSIYCNLPTGTRRDGDLGPTSEDLEPKTIINGNDEAIKISKIYTDV